MKKVSILLILALAGIGSWAQMIPTYNDIWIPMRDGELLQADVYIPDGVTSGEVILIQTPYNKNLLSFSLPMGVGTDLDSQPFIWVTVDWRGFYGSSGADLSDFTRGEDGYDICQWISEQTWHASRIGTWGPSALGGVQYQTIREHHPNHTCAVPLVATGEQSYESYFYGGVLEEARLNTLDALGYGLSPLVLSNPYENFVWDFAREGSQYAGDIDIPTLQIGGWYDHNIDKMMSFYTESRTMAEPDVRDEQWLLVGPWAHGGTGTAYVGSTIQGELTYENAAAKNDTMAWDFLMHYLLDEDNGWDETPMITYYEMGGNDMWHYSEEEDIQATETAVLYLGDGGRLDNMMGAGSSGFLCDPTDPSPSIGGATLHPDLEQGPYDQSSLESREDVLVFETDPLVGPVSVTGRVSVDLFVESDQPDGDIAIRLVDAYPDGRNMLINDGIKRLRFRNDSYRETDEVFMSPDEVYPVTVELPFTNYTWLPDHAIKIIVSGNHAIRFHVNLQNGGDMYEDGTPNNANIVIHHSEDYPSKVNLRGDNPDLSIVEETPAYFELYPNPVTDRIYIEGDQLTSYRIINGVGQVVYVGSANVSGSWIDVGHLSTGIYLIELENDRGEVARRKIIKK